MLAQIPANVILALAVRAYYHVTPLIKRKTGLCLLSVTHWLISFLLADGFKRPSISALSLFSAFIFMNLVSGFSTW
jgi:hypothetical protein